MYVGQKPTRACIVLLFKMPTINKTYLILSYPKLIFREKVVVGFVLF